MAATKGTSSRTKGTGKDKGGTPETGTAGRKANPNALLRTKAAAVLASELDHRLVLTSLNRADLERAIDNTRRLWVAARSSPPKTLTEPTSGEIGDLTEIVDRLNDLWEALHKLEPSARPGSARDEIRALKARIDDAVRPILTLAWQGTRSQWEDAKGRLESAAQKARDAAGDLKKADAAIKLAAAVVTFVLQFVARA